MGPLKVKLGGHTERHTDRDGRTHVRWVADRTVVGIPYDTPILGYRKQHRQHAAAGGGAEAPESFDLSVFNRGDYYGAVQQKVVSENISKVLYPETTSRSRARNYAWSSSSSSSPVRCRTCCASCEWQKIPLERFPREVLPCSWNDTHPAVAIAEADEAAGG